MKPKSLKKVWSKKKWPQLTVTITADRTGFSIKGIALNIKLLNGIIFS
jgi:hypothetical protein